MRLVIRESWGLLRITKLEKPREGPKMHQVQLVSPDLEAEDLVLIVISVALHHIAVRSIWAVPREPGARDQTNQKSQASVPVCIPELHEKRNASRIVRLHERIMSPLVVRDPRLMTCTPVNFIYIRGRGSVDLMHYLRFKPWTPSRCYE